MIDPAWVTRDAFARTIRLVSSANLRPPVLRALVEDEDLAALAEIEGATSTRLLAQDRGVQSLDAQEFVFGVPHAKFINAAFAYAKPRQSGRFNAEGRGAWYAALAVETCLAEVAFHMTAFLELAGDYHAVVDYAELYASLAGEFVDLRGSDHACLSPDASTAYPVGAALADEARAMGLNGVIYPSARHAGGTCIVALWPHAVQSVAQGALWRMTWSGEAEPTVSAL